VKNRVLVTGGGGSVGRGVAKQLHREGHRVRVFDLPGLDYTDLEGIADIEIVRGDITRADALRSALEDVGGVVHLAAILPPASEKNRDLTFDVNVSATLSLAAELNRIDPDMPVVFSSSVNTYGDTTRDEPPVGADRPQSASSIYGQSKIAAEEGLRGRCPHATTLRISGIAIPEFREPPEIWPFAADQRIEFVHRDDVVTALCRAVAEEEARGEVFIVAGGESWRKTGRSYIRDYYELLGVPIEEARFQDTPGYFDWYETASAQKVLGYQNNSYEDYLGQIRDEIRKLLGD
jgi:nucleoside-diphosphate-sugar epimerase